MRRARRAAATLVVLTACTSSPSGAAAPTPPSTPSPTASALPTTLGSPVALDPAHLEPLASLPACGPAPAASDDDPPDVTVLPPGAVVTAAEETGPLTQLTAYVALAPPEILSFYVQRPDLEILHIENEVFDAEVLVSDGVRRVIVNSQAACRDGSTLIATVVAESSGGRAPAAPAATPPAGAP